MNGRTLIVGRDRAHVRELTRAFPGVEIISASAFFDKVRLLGFLFHQKERDDHAPLIESIRVLAKDKLALKQAHRFSSLYSSFFHGTCPPKSVLKKIGPEDDEIKEVVETLALIEDGLFEKSLVNGVQALYEAWLLIKNKEILPFGLLGVEKVILYYLVDLTLLEMEVVKALSRLSISFEVRLPLFSAPGINVAVDFLAKLFESDADLFNIELSFEDLAKDSLQKPLLDGLFTETKSLDGAPFVVKKSSSIHAEADEISLSIANILEKDPQAKVALCVRKIDRNSSIYLRSLGQYGIGIKGRKGQVLLESPAGLLLETIFEARLLSLPKKELLGLIAHPVFVFFEPDSKKRAQILTLMDELGIDDRHLSPDLPLMRYQSQIERFKKVRDCPESRELLEEFLKKVEPMLTVLSLSNSFGGYLEEVVKILDVAFKNEEPSLIHLKEAIKLMAKSATSFADPNISLLDFLSLLKVELRAVTIPSPDQSLANAVEFLLLPELLGRKFDHVFIADITAGSMPQNLAIDPLMDDRARIRLNSLMGKPMLRVYFDDPFEPMPVPPRQALEPFWFASAIASAEKCVYFSHGVNDASGQEQAPSEFFIWLFDRHKACHQNEIQFSKKQHQRFLHGIREQFLETDRRSIAIRARKNAFLEQKSHEHAFLLNALSVQESFSGRLADKPSKALTPTMVEAFSGCRFKGFASRILNLKGLDIDQDDVDALLLGQIAHEVLEKYFEKPSADLKAVMDEVSQNFSKKHFIKNPEVLSSHLDLLFDMLLSLIKRLKEHSLAIGSFIFAKETDFGLSKFGYPGTSLTINGRQYLLGGRVDRIDKAQNNFLIFDYKLSSSDNLKILLSPKNLLKNHFQVPVYLRLVAEAFSLTQNEVAFALASIRDGELVFLSEKDPDLWSKIFEDGVDSMASAIDNIFAPIARGEIMATVGDSCTNCEMQFFCRKDGI